MKIADRIGGVVLSNDSFQEFHEQYPWLFDEGRLIGGKPVQGVGWVFTPRLPVRGAKSVRTVKKLSVTLSGGAAPEIGTTLTPVKAAKGSSKKAAVKVTKTPAKAAKKTAKPEPEVEKKPARRASTTKKAAAKAVPAAKVAKKAPVAAPGAPAEPAVALRRGRHPVNPEEEFTRFRTSHRIGSKIDGEVTAFTSHGAVITVSLKDGQQIECYAPTTSLGSPAPARARDVLKRGDRRTFRLVTVDVDRRIAELALL